MKATGIIRKMDKLGRVVIPKELTKVFGLEEKTPMEFFVEDDRIIIKKYTAGCIFCGEIEEVKEIKGKCICSNCIKEMIK